MSIYCEASMQTKPFGFFGIFYPHRDKICTFEYLVQVEPSAGMGKKMHPGLCPEHRVNAGLNTERFGWGTGLKLTPVKLAKP